MYIDNHNNYSTILLVGAKYSLFVGLDPLGVHEDRVLVSFGSNAADYGY